ncbi:MAG: fatty acid desaturase [Pseudomonadales bacterium]|nr:fatty acid desaturase [Pseudomonadales bacterium]NRA18168.1 fatty acid desaturase [Oceanospirillaceae bacterium]
MSSKTKLGIEWPTLALIIGCYLLWLLVLYNQVSFVLVWLALPLLLALHSSLQHEVLHGHPTRWAAFNEALVFIPLGVFLPYQRFRDLHLIHHRDEHLTDPYADPESHYQDPQRWQKLPTALRDIYSFNNSLVGRMLVGPALSIWLGYKADTRAMLDGDAEVVRAYGLHLVGLVAMLWLLSVWQINLLAYLLVAYLALSILKIRTFLEHRAHFSVAARTVVVEDRGLLALLFLNNNFHAVHHQHPGVAWYRLPGLYYADRAAFLEANQGYRYASYREVFSEYLWQAKEPVQHPQMVPPGSDEVQAGGEARL